MKKKKAFLKFEAFEIAMHFGQFDTNWASPLNLTKVIMKTLTSLLARRTKGSLKAMASPPLNHNGFSAHLEALS